jgi:hypothetical protein
MESKKALNTFMASFHLCEKHEIGRKFVVVQGGGTKIYGTYIWANSSRRKVIFCNNYCGYAMIRKYKREIYCKE